MIDLKQYLSFMLDSDSAVHAVTAFNCQARSIVALGFVLVVTAFQLAIAFFVWQSRQSFLLINSRSALKKCLLDVCYTLALLGIFLT